MDIQNIIAQCKSQPASQIATQVNDSLASHSALVVTAPPGAGKSTLLPLTILAGMPNDCGKILMLEPRRLAARQVAERMAEIIGEPIGNTIGYRVRFESCVSEKTRIEVLTEGILTRMLIDDATLDGVSVVIFDEFHERSINSDLALALTRRAQEIIRPDLNIVIMSATINADSLCSALNAPLIKSEGRMFPVKTIYLSYDINPRTIVDTIASAIVEAHNSYSGDILVFLPGQGEIERCKEKLGDTLSPTSVLPLYGNMSPEQQHKTIAPSNDGERKIVLATPIAETSITIEGVRIVIDSGLCRSVVFDARTGMSHLETVRISQDMATQRRGRAGRVAEGICMRLWTRTSEHLMSEHRKPEIEEADLAPMLLNIAAFGENDVENLPWLELPPRGNVAKARQLLVSLGAICNEGGITRLGKQMSTMACHPRIARMIISSKSAEMKALACDIAALLEEKDPMSDTTDTDLSLRISNLRAARRRGGALGRWQRIAQIAKEYRKMAHTNENNVDVSSEEIGLLTAYAYPERIAKAIDNIGRYRLSSGAVVQLDASDQLTAYTWLAIASLHTQSNATGRIFLAARFNPDELDSTIVSERDNVAWDSKRGCVVMQHEQRIGQLLVNSKPIHNADKQVIISVVCEAMKKDGLSMMAWSDGKVVGLQQRVASVAKWHPEMNLPDISTEHLISTASEWLPLYIDEGEHVKSTTTELQHLDLAEIIWNIIPYEQQTEIDRLAPSHIQVPTGSRIRVDYRQGADAPIVSVRLQECFGMKSTPRVNDNRQPILLELLSPGFKPVQLTQDLESFWQTTYFEVRKELRRRYPKHYWPENPLEAEAVRGVRSRNVH